MSRNRNGFSGVNDASPRTPQTSSARFASSRLYRDPLGDRRCDSLERAVPDAEDDRPEEDGADEGACPYR